MRLRAAGGILRSLVSLALLLLPLIGLAQQEDVDSDTATLILNVERALRLEVIGSPITATISAADFGKQVLPLGSFEVLVNSLVDYVVTAYGMVSPQDISVDVLQARVSEISGPFDRVLAGEFTGLGDAPRPLALFAGGNNIGMETVATVDFQLDLQRLAGRPLGDSYTFIITFTAMER